MCRVCAAVLYVATQHFCFPTGAIASLHDMISKLQRVVCHLNDRLASVEQINGIPSPAIAPSATGASFFLCIRLPFERLSCDFYFLPVPHRKEDADAEQAEAADEGGGKRLKRKR